MAGKLEEVQEYKDTVQDYSNQIESVLDKNSALQATLEQQTEMTVL